MRPHSRVIDERFSLTKIDYINRHNISMKILHQENARNINCQLKYDPYNVTENIKSNFNITEESSDY